MEIIDIEDLVKTWAIKTAELTHGSKSLAECIVAVDWSRTRFTTTGMDVFRPLPTEKCKQEIRTLAYKAIYDNRTNETQTHIFKIERTTDATVVMNVTNGFSRNGIIGVDIGVPDDVAENTTAFGSCLRIDSEDFNTIRHQLPWSINTTVKAPQMKRTVAELRINATTFACTFKTDVNVAGTVAVRITDKTGGTLMIIQQDIATLLADESEKLKGLFSILGRRAICTVAGELRFKYGISQDLQVTHEDL